MPIRLPDSFPAKAILAAGDIFAIDDKRARTQDIRPLEILIVNLMPDKITTETQLLRLISQSPLQINVEFLQMNTHAHKNVAKSHLDQFYLSFNEIKERFYDGLIITGAPVEELDFEEVDYWQELCFVMEWSKQNVTSVIHICWGAQAGLFYHYGVKKVMYQEKLFGNFCQYTIANRRLFRGFDDYFWGPQSRYTGINCEDLTQAPVAVVAKSKEIGPTILLSDDEHDIFLLGHYEYDTDTLHQEFLRDQKRGLNPKVPENYYPTNDYTKKPVNNWRGHSQLLCHNWLNDVYQITPYNLADIPKENQWRKKNTKK